jgi:hypothetical protein
MVLVLSPHHQMIVQLILTEIQPLQLPTFFCSYLHSDSLVFKL